MLGSEEVSKACSASAIRAGIITTATTLNSHVGGRVGPSPLLLVIRDP